MYVYIYIYIYMYILIYIYIYTGGGLQQIMYIWVCQLFELRGRRDKRGLSVVCCFLCCRSVCFIVLYSSLY